MDNDRMTESEIFEEIKQIQAKKERAIRILRTASAMVLAIDVIWLIILILCCCHLHDTWIF